MKRSNYNIVDAIPKVLGWTIFLAMLFLIVGFMIREKDLGNPFIGTGKNQNKTANNSRPKKLTKIEQKAVLAHWESTPEGINYNKWKASDAGKKVHASEAKIQKNIAETTKMDGIVYSLSLPPGSRLGFGLMVKIQGEDFILAFGPENSGNNAISDQNGFEPLHKLKVNDKITIKSHHVSHAPKYAYPIIAGDYIEKDGKVIFQRTKRKGGC